MTADRSVAADEGRGPSDEELREAVPAQTGGRELRVGLFVLLGLVGFMAVLYLTTDPAYFRGRYLVTTLVDDAGGVRTGDPVQMRGVNIGRVQGFSMARDSVQITLEIEGQWEIPTDSRTRLTGMGLLGGRVVEVVPGDAERALPPGGSLTGASTADFSSAATNLSTDAETVLERIRTLLSEPTVSALQGSAKELNQLLTQLSSFTQEQRGEVARLVESLNRSAEGLEEASEAGPEAAQAIARADSVLARLNQTGATLDRAATSLETVLGALERGEGTLGRLSRDDSLYRNLNQAAESLHLLAEDIRENPGRYISVEIF